MKLSVIDVSYMVCLDQHMQTFLHKNMMNMKIGDPVLVIFAIMHRALEIADLQYKQGDIH